MPPTTCPRTTQKSAAGKEYKNIPRGCRSFFKKRFFGSGSPKGAAALKGGYLKGELVSPQPISIPQPISCSPFQQKKKAEKIWRKITWKDL